MEKENKKEIRKKEQEHFINCSAPICSCDPNPNYKDEVIWIPGEQVCRHQPYKLFQERQIEINDWARKGQFDINRYFTVYDLENLGNLKRRAIEDNNTAQHSHSPRPRKAKK